MVIFQEILNVLGIFASLFNIELFLESGPKKIKSYFAQLCKIQPEKHKLNEISKLLTLVSFQNGTNLVYKVIFTDSRTTSVKK